MKRSSLLVQRLLALACAVLTSVTLASGQNEQKPATPEKERASVQKRASSRRTAPKEKAVEPPAATAPVEPAPAPNPAKAEADTTVQDANKTETEKETSVPEVALPQDPIALLREQIAAAPDSEKTRLQMELVNHLVSTGAKQVAINELRLMSVDDRFNPQGLYNMGNALARLNDIDGAVVAYRKAIEQRKGRYSRALNNLGVVLLRQGRWDESYEALNSALRIENFRYAEASYNLGRLYSARGENDLAVREWKRAVSVNPEHKAAAQALARVGSAGRIEVASRFGSDTSSPPPVRVTKQPAESPAATTKPAKIVKATAGTHTLTVDPETYSFLQRARAARERGRQDEAATNYRHVISRMGGYFGPANLELSYALITLKKPEEAIATLTQVIEHDGSRYPISYYHLARLYETKGDLKLAEENYDRAATSYSEGNAQFLLDLSRVREKRGDLRGALAALEQYLAAMEQKNFKPEWSNERLASLKQKLAASQPKP